MQPNEALATLGEVAAAFAGFSGVVAVLGVESLAALPGLHRFRFANLLMTSVGAALLAFLPVVLGQFSIGAGTIWASSSLLMAVFAGSLLVTRWRAGLRLGRLNSGLLNLWMALCWLVALSAVLLLQVANLVEWPLARSGAPYVAGVFGLLFLSGLQFISIALPRDASDAPREQEP